MKNAKYEVTMPDGSRWQVPVSVIAESRAKCYAADYGGDLEKSLNKDTYPLFEEDSYEIHDWASNNMNWKDVEAVAICVAAADVDFQEGWVNGDYEIK